MKKFASPSSSPEWTYLIIHHNQIYKFLDYVTSKNRNVKVDPTRAIRKVSKGMMISLPKYISVISMKSASDKYVGPIGGSP